MLCYSYAMAMLFYAMLCYSYAVLCYAMSDVMPKESSPGSQEPEVECGAQLAPVMMRSAHLKLSSLRRTDNRTRKCALCAKS